jgi:hypothetical protein
MYKIIGVDEKEYGPISADQLRQWISEGRINASTKVQPEGTGVWKRVVELPEFAAALSVAAPSHTAPITMAPPHAPSKANLMAVWAMITGFLSFVPCCWGVVGIVSIVLGCVALSQIKKNPQQTGSGFAITGIVLGIISIIMAIVGTVIVAAFPGFFQNLQTSFQQ